MATISEQIAAIDATIAAKNAEIATLQQSAKSWRDSKSQCAGTAKKKAECAAGKEAQAVIRDTQAAAVQKEIDGLNTSKRNLLEAQKAENTIGIKLADQGISQAAAIVEAEGKAKAAITASQIKSTAEATAIEKTADASSFQKTAILGIVLIFAVVVLVVVIKKIQKKKPVKK